jgi:hypothetical protein
VHPLSGLRAFEITDRRIDGGQVGFPHEVTTLCESKVIARFLRFTVLAVWCVVRMPCSAMDLQDLEAGFRSPPDSAHPWVYWFWMNGNVTREGITADLEAMKRVGIGGVLLMDVNQDIPAGPVRFASPEWRELFHHAVVEATRLGLKVSVNNAAGWTGSGGPWITPELGMQRLASVSTNLTGPSHFRGSLRRPREGGGLAHDVAVLAFPTLVGEGAPWPGFNPKITASSMDGFQAKNLVDSDPGTYASLPAPHSHQREYLELEFKEPFKASFLKLTGTARAQTFQGLLQTSEDGRAFQDVREFRNRGTGVSLMFDGPPARYYRIVLTDSDPRLERLEFSELVLTPVFHLQWGQAKSGLGPLPSPSVQRLALTNVPSGGEIQLGRLLDLTSKLDAEGQLEWDVPPGLWTVLRFSYEPTGQNNHPAPEGGAGLECDKLSREAIGSHFSAFLGRLVQDSGNAAGKALAGTHIDSWEVGFQNWTPHFVDEFRRRRGYDPIPFLAASTERVVASVEQSERFLWDMRRTIAELVADNYAGGLAELAHHSGLELSMESYDNGPFDDLLCAGRVDVPMAEFWLDAQADLSKLYLRPMPSAAHTNGKRVTAAEAFTAYPQNSKWQNHPFTLKALGDAAFCEGINRLVIHRFAHQPWLGRSPGMTMGQFGLEYDRTETWWEFSRPWHEYLARCQYLLQSGLFVADVCYLTEEGAFLKSPKPQVPRPEGYDYDLASPDVVLTRMSVKDGRLTLPDGMSYRVLVLPQTETMTPKLLRKLEMLVEGGATILGPRPVKSPSLADYPQCDAEVRGVAGDLWGACDGKTVREHSFGKGRVIWGKTLPEVLREAGVAPDFQQLTPARGASLRYIHRHIEGAEVYFLANPNMSPTNVASSASSVGAEPVVIRCSFRVSDKQPEIWHPDSGRIELPAQWRQVDERTELPLRFDPAGSLFVIFRKTSRALDPVVEVKRDGGLESVADVTFDESGKVRLVTREAGKYAVRTAAGTVVRSDVSELPEPIKVIGPWNLSFPAGSGAPELVTLERLIPWNDSTKAGVRYFSGTASYTTTFFIPSEWLGRDRRVQLDLGRVQVIARVKVNGQDLGIRWKPPFEIEVTRALRPGTNTLEVSVANLWPNRLIGDEQLPDDCLWRAPATEAGLPLLEWPKWLLEGKPRPTGRLTFSTWKHWTKDSRLLESGLLGPVVLRAEADLRLN